MIAMESQKTGSPEFSLAAHFNCHAYRKQALTYIIGHSVVVITGTVIPEFAYDYMDVVGRAEQEPAPSKYPGPHDEYRNVRRRGNCINQGNRDEVPGYAIRVRGMTLQLPKFGAALL